MNRSTTLRIGRPQIGDEEQEAVARVLRSGQLSQGAEVAEFEEEFSQRVGGRPCVAVNSGTSALLVALLSVGIGAGDEVIVPSFSFAATANAVVLAGARPVFVDIEPTHYGIDPEAVLAAIGPRTAAIVPVHLYGHPADVPALRYIARRYDLALIEDCAQAHLASIAGEPVGSFGSAGAFSFYPTKNMTTGEGGIVSCADEDIARRARLLRNQGMLRRYENEVVGYNLRMTDIHAAIGRVQLRKLGGWTERRRANARLMTKLLAQAPDHEIEYPRVADAADPVWHQYTVLVPDRDVVIERLGECGVVPGVYYPTPIHRLPAYDLELDMPVTDAACREVLSLPAGPDLEPADVERVAVTLMEVAAS